jgi:hypothetical protein
MHAPALLVLNEGLEVNPFNFIEISLAQLSTSSFLKSCF